MKCCGRPIYSSGRVNPSRRVNPTGNPKTDYWFPEKK